MNYKFLYIFLLSFAILKPTFEIKFPDNICSTEQACKDKSNPCKVYCSVECGPRDRLNDDRPVFENGVCYGKPWDRDNLFRCPKPVGNNEEQNEDSEKPDRQESAEESK